MPTENRRIATYLPKHIDDRLATFKSERAIKGDSQALITILSEFFEVEQQVSHQVDYAEFATKEELEDLRAEVGAISSRLNDLYSKLPSESHKETEDATLSDEHFDALVSGPLNLLPQEDETQILPEVIETPPVESNQEIGILARDLAKRLSVGQSTMSTRKQDTPERFADWTRSKDPDDVAWAFMPQSNQFVPVGEISVEAQRSLENLIKKPLDGFATGELAKRLGISSSTLSHWKSSKEGKSPDELLKATREKDPDGVGWILIPETNRFKPERDLQNQQTHSFQGELLSESLV